MNTLSSFMNIFRGSNLAHGVYYKANGNMATVLTPATEEDYSKHLTGEQGLGIIPVDENGKCWWGAIDIDIETISHADLYRKIKDRNLPLTVFRSKSGGAHVYVFYHEPQSSTVVQSTLKKWAGLLGFPSQTEIFPKQTKSTTTNVGNWLNSPYFNAPNTVRYAMGPNGSMSIEEFLDTIVYFTGKERIDERASSDLIQIDLMPPCLKELTDEGLPSGHRNVGLFSYGVFYRKSSPNGWEDKLRYHNQNYVSPPLQTREVEALIKSLSARQYQYKCDEEPLCSHCDRKTCLTLAFGVGHKPWEDVGNFDEITVTNLRKILTDPPTYILEVNSQDMHLSSEELRVFDKLRKRIFEIHDLVLRPIKQAQWEQQLKGLITNKVNIEAPDDASSLGSVYSKIDDFLALSDRSKSREDLLRGMPYQSDDKILFQVDFLQKYLLSQKVQIANQDLYSILHRHECTFSLIKIKGKVIRAWSIPISRVNRQTEGYTPVEFKKEEPEL